MEKTESRIQEEQGKSKKEQGIREAKSVLISNIEQGMSNGEGQKPCESVKSVAPFIDYCLFTIVVLPGFSSLFLPSAKIRVNPWFQFRVDSCEFVVNNISVDPVILSKNLDETKRSRNDFICRPDLLL